jgi:hypothetical protein
MHDDRARQSVEFKPTATVLSVNYRHALPGEASYLISKAGVALLTKRIRDRRN